MSTFAPSFPIEGVWIGRVTETSDHPLDRWADGIRQRSNEAFSHLYELLADDLASFAFGLVGDRRTAEDIVQEAFVELVRAAPKLKGNGAAIKAWLFKSVRFGCLDEYRRRSRRPELPMAEPPESPASGGLPEWIDPALEKALSDLGARQRTMIVLRHVVGLSGEEVAQIMGISRKAVYATTNRAEASLRAALGGRR